MEEPFFGELSEIGTSFPCWEIGVGLLLITISY